MNWPKKQQLTREDPNTYKNQAMKKSHPFADKSSSISGIDEPAEKHSNMEDSFEWFVSKPGGEEVLAIMDDIFVRSRICWEVWISNIEQKVDFKNTNEDVNEEEYYVHSIKKS